MAPPTLAFLPGAAGRAGFWRPVAARLGDLGPAWCPGWPGFGDEPPDPAVRSLDDLFGWLVARLPPGRCHLIAQSMGGVLAARLALELPDRVARLVLAATSGGLDLSRLGAADWRPGYLAERPALPPWFVKDRTDLTERLHRLAAPTLLLWSDADPISPPAVAAALAARLPDARTVILRGGGHAFASERPEEAAAAIRAFLAGGDPRATASPGR